jgi:ribonuclease Z
MVQPRLVNDEFGDAGLLLDFSFASRAILFDIGDLSPLSNRELSRVRQVFVSHLHMDHFAGFDQLLRYFLHRDAEVRFFGPPGLVDAVDAKLHGYVWNLLDAQSEDFSIIASEWDLDSALRSARFSARRRFAREEMGEEPVSRRLLLNEPDFHIQAAELDHGIPSLAFAFQERLRVNVHKARLDELGLAVGPWLTEAKRLVRAGADLTQEVETSNGSTVALGELVKRGALVQAPGERIAYVTDLAFSEANIATVTQLARRADYLFIEAVFAGADESLASARKHLTAAQAGTLAAAAGASRAMPMHFSQRYLGEDEGLRQEFEAAFRGHQPADGQPR